MRRDSNSRSISSSTVTNPASRSARSCISLHLGKTPRTPEGFGWWLVVGGSSTTLHRREPVPELVLLCLQILTGRVVGGNLERNGLGDGEPVALQADELARVVGQEA